MLLKIALYGDPFLRKKTQPVKEITEEIRKLVADMVETMHDKNGIGLSATQINSTHAIFITNAPMPDEKFEKWVPGKLRIFINPKLSNPSKEVWEQDEGCLSIPGLYGEVTRPWKITIEYMDLNGDTHKEEFEGMEARVIMHENDHINGVLYIDRMVGKKRQEMEAKLKELKKKSKK
jgi:peptide deformylase